MKAQTKFIPPVEPVLPLDDIQGIAVPGFFKPHQTLLGLVFPRSGPGIVSVKRWLRKLTQEVTTGREALSNRRQFRKNRGATGRPLLAIAFTASGLSHLTASSRQVGGVAFQQGLARRSSLLGDPQDRNSEGNPDHWIVGGNQKALDAMMVVAGDNRPSVTRRVATLRRKLIAAGIRVIYSENGDVRPDLPGHEHFGFDDGISQPGIRGRASHRKADFVTPRHLRRGNGPESYLFGYPGQDLLWPGQFVLGQPASSPDPLVSGIASPAIPEWTRNGSFLVFRRLRQDVGLFWRTMRAKAAKLGTAPGFTGLTDETLASKLVGRWPSGAPVNRTPSGDLPGLGKDALANNDFGFDSDSPKPALASPDKHQFAHAKADPVGLTCPWAAHIRKVNTRDSASDMGGREATYTRRLLRVGVPFGKPLKDRYAALKDDPQKGQRGLLFLSIQASIEDQFEFLVARWMGDPSRPKSPAGHDILVGQNDAPGEDRVRQCVLLGTNGQAGEFATAAQWIIPTGGGYFFLPSISALAEVLGK